MADTGDKAAEASTEAPAQSETAVSHHSEDEKRPAPTQKDAEAAPTASSKREVEDAPDPDSDDLDDLDDMLDEFSPTHTVPAPPPPVPSSGPGRPSSATTATAAKPSPAEPSPEDFAAQLQKEMSSLMGEIDESPEMRQQLEAMMKELGVDGDGAPGPATAAAAGVAGSKAKAAAGDDAFQETIRKTMERMQASGEQASAAATAETSEEDMLAQLLKEMAAGGEGGGGGGEGGEEDFSKMLLGMMEQLTNKEILYEPMKDLEVKFPGWMEKNRETVGKEDLARYEEQQRVVGEIVGRFEREGYSDDNAEDREFIVERMQKMQAAGSPPPDLVGDMKETQDALGDLDQGCAQQ